MFRETVPSSATQYGPPASSLGKLHRNTPDTLRSGRRTRQRKKGNQGSSGECASFYTHDGTATEDADLDLTYPIAAVNRFTYKTASTQTKARSIIDMGACASVVGKMVLVAAMHEMGVSTLPNDKIRRKLHRYGDYKDERTIVCSVKVPFRSVCPDGQDGARFEIYFDVIEGDLPF